MQKVVTTICSAKCTAFELMGMIGVATGCIRQVAALQLHNIGILYGRYLGIFRLTVIRR